MGPAHQAVAQVTPDGRLSTTINSTDNLNFVVEAGDRAGNNLFHSFESFSVPTEGSVYFNNPVDITHIFSRVTGASPSAIDGLIEANGDANLFLLNPNGIRFGEGAELKLGGSFFATTADRLVFDDGAIFSATDLPASSLLSLHVPVGIQFGTTAASIENRSRALAPDSGLTVGLQVPEGQSLTLLGGPIEFDYGVAAAHGGQVNLGAVAPESLVALDVSSSDWMLDYEQAIAFQDISLTGTNSFNTYEFDDDFLVTSIDASGEPGGSIDMRGRQIQLDGAGLIADNWGTENADNQITIRSSEAVVLTGEPEETDSVVRIKAFNAGKGGDILIESPSLTIQSTSGIYTFTEEEGAGGDLIIASGNIAIKTDSYISTETEGPADAGNLTIMAGNLFVDQSFIGSLSLSSGQAGDVKITAQELIATNRAEVLNEAFDGGGDAGPTQIAVDRLEIRNGSEIGSAASNGGGDAGTVTIQASEFIKIEGTGEFEDPLLDGELALIGSAIFSISDRGEGDGGDLQIETPWLQLSDGGTIGANTFSQGDSGNITIRAERIDISESGFGDPGRQDRFGITNTVERGSTGNGGNIDITANQLNIYNGGSIASNSLGQGNAGSLSIEAQTINLQGRLEEVPLVGGETLNQTLPSQIASFGNNDFAAGSVTIQAEQISLSDRAEISVSNSGQGDSGALSIQAQTLQLERSSRLEADVNGGEQGNIYLTIGDVLSLYNNSSITANATGRSQGGNINIGAGFIIAPATQNSDISANAEASFGGKAAIATNTLFGIQARPQATEFSDITASSELGGFEGTVQVDSSEAMASSQVVELPTMLVDASELIAAGCNLNEGQFVLSGRGGLPLHPSNQLVSPLIWRDAHPATQDISRIAALVTGKFSDREPTRLQEATTIAIAPNGSRQLVAAGDEEIMITNLDCMYN